METNYSLFGRISRRRGSITVAVICAISLVSVSVVASSTVAEGHGSLASPISRQLACEQLNVRAWPGGQSTSDACNRAWEIGGDGPFTNWNEVQIGDTRRGSADLRPQYRTLIPDGQLCGAGTQRAVGLNYPSDKWPTTDLPGGGAEFQMTYRATAVHNPYVHYMWTTNSSYKPNNPLNWDNLNPTPFYVSYAPEATGQGTANQGFQMSTKLPDVTGKNLIYSIWQGGIRPDGAVQSNEAFVGCSDVNYGKPSGGTDTEAPTTPKDFAASNVTATSVQFQWQKSTDNVGVVNYVIRGNGTDLANIEASRTTAEVNNLLPNTAYKFTIVAQDAQQNTSKASNEVKVTTKKQEAAQPPSPPDLVSAEALSARSAQVAWNPSTSPLGIREYRILNGKDQVAVASGTSSSVVITGLSASTEYTFRAQAVDNAGAISELGKAVTVTTRPVEPGGETVGRLATGYWQNFKNGAPVQKLRDVNDAFNLVVVSFAEQVQETPGKITFNLDPVLGYSGVQEFKNDIAKLHDAGKKVIISVGGELGNVKVTDEAQATAFSSSVIGLMNEYGFDGVDIDLEHGLDAFWLSKAMRQIHDQIGPNLVYTMAPQTIDMVYQNTSYWQLIENTKDFLTVVNTQYYNSGTMLDCNGNVIAQGSINFLVGLTCRMMNFGLAPSQIGLGLPANADAAGGGYLPAQDVRKAFDCLTVGKNCGSVKPQTLAPDLRGVMTWSTNWDQKNSNKFAEMAGQLVKDGK